MNPYLIIAFLIALAVVGAGGYATGHSAGTNAQKAKDQAQFDKINRDLEAQKAAANAQYRKSAEETIAAQAEAEKVKSQLEKAHVQQSAATDAHRRELSGVKLRFATIQSAGYRDSGSPTEGTASAASCNASAATVELPDQITGDLRQLTLEADQLADDYRLCYAYVNK